MPEKVENALWHVVGAFWYIVGGAALTAGLVQAGTLLTRDTMPPVRQALGAVLISIVVAALVTAVAIDRFSLSAVTAGALGIVSGFIPGAAWANLAYRTLEAQLRERLKVELEEKENEKKEEGNGDA